MQALRARYDAELPPFVSIVSDNVIQSCWAWIFHRENGTLRHSGKRPIKVKKRPMKDRKRPTKANGLFSGTPPWWKTVPLKGPLTAL